MRKSYLKIHMLDKSMPYQDIKEQLILRDHLAVDRTILANERTFLAYIRTAITLFVAGLSFIHFRILGVPLIDITVGIIFIVFGTCTFLVGLVRYKEMQGRIREINHEELEEKNPL